MITAARALARQHTSGKYHSLLSFEDFDNLGHVITNSVDSLLTDSANSASSYATGHKSSVNALGVYADSSSDPFDDPKVELITELIRRRQPKKAIGIVSTAYGQVSHPDPIHLDLFPFFRTPPLLPSSLIPVKEANRPKSLINSFMGFTIGPRLVRDRSTPLFCSDMIHSPP